MDTGTKKPREPKVIPFRQIFYNANKTLITFECNIISCQTGTKSTIPNTKMNEYFEERKEFAKALRDNDAAIVEKFKRDYDVDYEDSEKTEGEIKRKIYNSYCENVKWFVLTAEGVNSSDALITIQYGCWDQEEKDPSGIVTVTGKANHVPRNKKSLTNDVVVIADSVESISTEFKHFKPTKEDSELLKEHFGSINNENFFEKIGGLIAPSVVGRTNQKAIAALVVFSPTHIPLFDNKPFLLTALFAGDPRETKDLLVDDIIKNCPGGAVQINAENAKRTGLVGGAIKDPVSGQFIIRWGKLVKADGAMAHLKGISGYDATAWSQLREILSDRKATIDMIVQGEKEAKCRLIITGNCRKAVPSYKTKYLAFRDTGSHGNLLFEETPDVLRIHLPVIFSQKDVSYSDVDGAGLYNVERSIPKDVFNLKIRDTWRRTLNDFDVDSIIEQRKLMMSHLAEWRKKYGQIMLAPLHKEAIQIFMSLIMSSATIKHKVNENDKIVVDASDVELIKNILDWLFLDLQLPMEARVKDGLKKEAKTLIKDVIEFIKNPEEKQETVADAVSFYLKLVTELYTTNVRKADELAAAIGDSSRRTLFTKKSLAEKTIEEKFGQKEPIIMVQGNSGFELTEYGNLVAKEIDLLKGLGRWV